MRCALLWAVVACTMASCAPPLDAQYVDVAVFVDFTEINDAGGSLLADADKDSGARITRLLDLITTVERRYNGGSITFYPIGDQSLLGIDGPTKQIELGSRDENRLDREDTIRKMREDLEADLRSFLKRNDEFTDPEFEPGEGPDIYQQSMIVRPLCEYFRKFGVDTKSDPPGRPVMHKLIIFSDLLENSPLYSFYPLNRVITNNGEVARKFLDQCLEQGVETLINTDFVGMDEWARNHPDEELPTPVEYQMIPYPLPPGMVGLGERQFEASEIFRDFFQRLGLRENTNLLR